MGFIDGVVIIKKEHGKEKETFYATLIVSMAQSSNSEYICHCGQHLDKWLCFGHSENCQALKMAMDAIHFEETQTFN